MTEKKLSDIEKLQILLPHWLEHNKSHGAEFSQWAATVSAAGDSATAALIRQAAEHLQKADEFLSQALASIGGPLQGHADHHHHHD
jgi:hypothetical protein